MPRELFQSRPVFPKLVLLEKVQQAVQVILAQPVILVVVVGVVAHTQEARFVAFQTMLMEHRVETGVGALRVDKEVNDLHYLLVMQPQVQQVQQVVLVLPGIQALRVQLHQFLV